MALKIVTKHSHSLDDLRGLPWLVAARNDIQSTMLELWQRWKDLGPPKRQTALDAAFSLWRAVFLLVEKAEIEKPYDRVDTAAEAFLEKVIRTNTVTFNDDLTLRAWSSGYYVENAIYRVRELTGWDSSELVGSPTSTVRVAWNQAFQQLRGFVSGTIPGTTNSNQSKADSNQSA